MIYFSPIATATLQVQLRELTVRDAVDLAAMPLSKHELGVSALLRRIVESAAGRNTDPGRWTVQERTFVVAHYIACSSDSPNFPVGTGRFLDYLITEQDSAPEAVEAGTACGDDWTVHQLTGDEAVAMESVCTSRLDWITADMAARMRVQGKDQDRPDPSTRPAEFAAWLADRMALFQAMPESDFEDLFLIFRGALEKLRHLFDLALDESGHIVLPRADVEGGAALAPARFPADAAIGRVARHLGP